MVAANNAPCSDSQRGFLLLLFKFICIQFTNNVAWQTHRVHALRNHSCVDVVQAIATAPNTGNKSSTPSLGAVGDAVGEALGPDMHGNAANALRFAVGRQRTRADERVVTADSSAAIMASGTNLRSSWVGETTLPPDGIVSALPHASPSARSRASNAAATAGRCARRCHIARRQ